jgi:hypothetical protein
VTTTQLQAAIAANRPARPTGARTDRGDGLASEFATALGADATKVTRSSTPTAPPARRRRRRPRRSARPSPTTARW